MAEAIAVAQTPYTLKFFEMINSPQGPWLQMLQRAYYDDRTRHDHCRCQGADEGDRGRVTGVRGADGAAAPRPREANPGIRARRRKLVGLIYLAPALIFVLAFTASRSPR